MSLRSIPYLFRAHLGLAYCDGDQSSSIICSIRHHNSAGLRWLPSSPCLRASALRWAVRHTYSPLVLLLRLISRSTVDADTSISRDILLMLHFLFIPRYISYLCSEVNCLYICNTKLINLGETSVSFFVLYCCWTFLGALRPRHLGFPRSVFHCFTTKIVALLLGQ